ncbi:hypothetical protein EVAR_59129_1 [Eumeta japonica]|uniref:Uncharacterized protein n=1 Tax=Eumeta variegata TaxID=151549 RepID=A0A4C1ZJ98_EUMVA|nr:hypothetical protein EVAR_59129_1 [Eumeta japonica]
MVTKELPCTHRNPMDVAYALNEGLRKGGGTSEETIIVRIAAKHKLHDSVSHAVLAVTRHTVSCVYHTDDAEDAIGRFIKRAVVASENKIKDNNVKMSIRNRDKTIMNVLAENWKQ